MNPPLQVELQPLLATVMRRFYDSFLGEDINLGEDKVRFRERPDFSAPLVTVLGHTYGLRLLAGSDNSNGCLVETSVNVYDDEFELDQFKQGLNDIYEWSHVSRIIANFATPEDETAMGGSAERLAALFRLDAERDVEVVEKSKKTASVVTGRLVDRVLQVRYGLVESELARPADLNLFSSGVYLYCVRPFAAAYRKSLTLAPPGV